MTSKKDDKETTSKKTHGLSKAEKIAVPFTIVIAVWAVYSFTQPAPNSTTFQVTYSSTASLSQSSGRVGPESGAEEMATIIFKHDAGKKS